MSTKEIALDTIRNLPDHATWQEIEERIHFVAAIEEGLEDIRRGRVVPHEEVQAALKGWLSE